MPKKAPCPPTSPRGRKLNEQGKVELKPPSKLKHLTEVVVAGGEVMKLGDIAVTDAKLHGSIEKIHGDGTVMFKLVRFEKEAGSQLRIAARLIHPATLSKNVFR